MSSIGEIRPDDLHSQQQMDALLLSEGIRRDRNLDYSCGVFEEDGMLIAAGSSFRNTLRCLAVSSSHRGEGLMNQVVSHLLEKPNHDQNIINNCIFSRQRSADMSPVIPHSDHIPDRFPL